MNVIVAFIFGSLIELHLSAYIAHMFLNAFYFIPEGPWHIKHNCSKFLILSCLVPVLLLLSKLFLMSFDMPYNIILII